MGEAFTKFPFRRQSHHSSHAHFLEVRVERNETFSAAAVHGVPPLETFEAVEHPSELVDVDQPAMCPPPERCIQQDGLMWKEKLAASLERNHEKNQWQQGFAVARTGLLPRRRVHHSPREKYLPATHTASKCAATRAKE